MKNKTHQQISQITMSEVQTSLMQATTTRTGRQNDLLTPYLTRCCAVHFAYSDIYNQTHTHIHAHMQIRRHWYARLLIYFALFNHLYKYFCYLLYFYYAF